MKNLILGCICVLLLPTLATAAPFQEPWEDWGEETTLVAKNRGHKKGKNHKERREKRRAKVEKKIRTYLVLELTDELDLDDAMALKLSSTIEKTQKEQHALREKAHNFVTIW